MEFVLDTNASSKQDADDNILAEMKELRETYIKQSEQALLRPDPPALISDSQPLLSTSTVPESSFGSGDRTTALRSASIVVTEPSVSGALGKAHPAVIISHTTEDLPNKQLGAQQDVEPGTNPVVADHSSLHTLDDDSTGNDQGYVHLDPAASEISHVTTLFETIPNIGDEVSSQNTDWESASEYLTPGASHHNVEVIGHGVQTNETQITELSYMGRILHQDDPSPPPEQILADLAGVEAQLPRGANADVGGVSLLNVDDGQPRTRMQLHAVNEYWRNKVLTCATLFRNGLRLSLQRISSFFDRLFGSIADTGTRVLAGLATSILISMGISEFVVQQKYKLGIFKAGGAVFLLLTSWAMRRAEYKFLEIIAVVGVFCALATFYKS
ncbi:MAG: hypothetical protein M1822_003161 [Bathelium mastoideum]|nr:MAG: hypothetical protein M1822_003161 [Bathelium mastoideum]